MPNINRDFLIILDAKSGEVDSPNIYYFNTDKNTSNLYVQMVLKETSIEATPIDNAANYSIKANILKPNMVAKEVEGTLVNPEKAIYEFVLPSDCTDFSGNAKIEFEVFCKVDGVEEIATSFATKFKVHGSILTEQNKYIKDSSDYPILKELMAEVVEINKTANELDTTIRTLQADMIEANNEIKTNEATRQANEATRIANEVIRKEAEKTRVSQEVTRVEAEAIREGQETSRVTDESDRKTSENQRKANENVRTANEVERNTAEQSRIAQENTRVANEEIRQSNEANREVAEQIRKANEEARIAEHEVMRTEHDQTMTTVNEVKAENATLMENDKKIADRMTQVEISDKRQYVIMEGLMNSAGDGYLKIEDTGNDTTLYNSVEGFVDVKNITGNTMVNNIKNSDDELTLNADINTSGQSVTLTTAVDNGQVDVLAEGNTMVNVCDQQEAVAITKSYTVETGNHIALQGEYDGKARPVVSGNTLVNIIDSFGSVINAEADFSTGSYKCTANGTARHLYYKVIPKTSTTYTAIAYVNKNTINDKFSLIGLDVTENNSPITIPTGFTGLFVSKFTTKADNLDNIWETDLWKENTEGEIEVNGFMILEGDYTNKPLPDYFTGMQSSFEDKVVTQEMVDNGKELAENLGKYKVEYKVTGKNKFDGKVYKSNGYYDINGEWQDGFVNIQSYRIPVCPNISYTKTGSWNGINAFFDKNMNFISAINSTTFTTPNNCYYMVCSINSTIDLNSIQIEEGSTATDCEPYKESIKTYYLNSPLLEGDTIEESGGNVYHVHRYGKFVIDGTEDDSYFGYVSATFPSDDSVMFRYGNKSSNINIEGQPICNKFPNADVAYNRNIEGVLQSVSSDFGALYFRILKSKLSTPNENGFKLWLQSNPTTVVCKLASPTKELISQSDTILTDSYVAGHLDFDTAVPVEKVKFGNFGKSLRYLYSSTNYIFQFESDNIGKIYGFYSQGLKASNINIVKGLNKINFTTSESQTYSGIDIDGIGFNMSNIVVTEATDKDFGYFQGMKSVGELEENTIEIVSANGTDSTTEGYLSNSKQILLNEPLRAVGNTKDRFIKIDGKWYVERNCAERNYETDDETNTSYKTDKVKTVYTLPSPTYEPVEIAPTVNTYTDVTRITNNSTIPMNMPIVNSGYEIIAKPSTKYTVVGIDNGRIGDSTIVNGTITTPATITDNFLRPYGTGTTSKVMLLEGEPANIPSYFKGIKSVFEDKVTEDGKYAVEVKVVGKNKFDGELELGTIISETGENVNYNQELRSKNYSIIPNIPFTISMYPNTNGYIGLRYYDKNYKYLGPSNGVKNGSVIGVGEHEVPKGTYYIRFKYISTDLSIKFQLEEGTVASEYEPYHETKQTLYLDEPLYNTNNITIYNDKLGYWKNWDSIVLDGSDDENWEDNISQDRTYTRRYNTRNGALKNGCGVRNTSINNIFSSSNNVLGGVDYECASNFDNNNFYIKVLRAKAPDLASFKQYLSENPVTVVYQLAEPEFVTLVKDTPNWVIGSWDNCSIHFDSIIPLKDTRYRYTGNVPSVVAMSDEVATNSAVSDEQDSLIVDLATQVAVLEMMTL